MSRLATLCIPALFLVAACGDTSNSGTTQAESEAVPADDGEMAAPDASSNMDGSTTTGSDGAMDRSTSNGTMTNGTSDSNMGNSGAGTSGSTTGTDKMGPTTGSDSTTGDSTTDSNGTMDKGATTMPPPSK